MREDTEDNAQHEGGGGRHAPRPSTALHDLRPFLGQQQLEMIGALARGEEGEFFVAQMEEYAERVRTMPKTYDQQDVADPIAYLHYFLGNMDWYITERDVDTDGAGQVQAFGTSNLGYGAGLGYISIPELLENGVELDLYFTPAPLSTCKAAQR